MKELVGVCHICKKDVYCLDGFLNGLIDHEGKLICMDCSLEEEIEGTGFTASK